MIDGTVLGAQLRAIRVKAGVTRKQLAQAVDCSPSHLWRIEAGQRQYASIELLHRIANHLSQKSGRDVVVEEFTTTTARTCTCTHAPVSA